MGELQPATIGTGLEFQEFAHLCLGSGDSEILEGAENGVPVRVNESVTFGEGRILCRGR